MARLGDAFSDEERRKSVARQLKPGIDAFAWRANADCRCADVSSGSWELRQTVLRLTIFLGLNAMSQGAVDALRRKEFFFRQGKVGACLHIEPPQHTQIADGRCNSELVERRTAPLLPLHDGL